MGLRQGCVESTGPGWGRLGLPGPGRPGTGGNGAYDNNPNSDRSGEDLSDACLSFQSSIELEGQHQRGEPPQQLNKQTWWREHLEAQNKEAALQTTTWQSPAKIPSKTNTTKRGAKQGRGCPTQGWAGGTRAPTTAPAGPPTTRGGKAARLPAKAPAGRGRAGAAAKPDKSAKPAGNSPKAKLLSDKSEQDCCPKPVHEERVSVSGPLNRRSHVARLGLARVLSRSIDTQNEAEQLYQEVIAMAPEVRHQDNHTIFFFRTIMPTFSLFGYMLEPSDPQAAVDVFCRFPLKPVAEQSFNDAFISGEIVRLLMSQKQHDHSQPGPSLVAHGCIEKYVNILDGESKTALLRNVYARINNKQHDDPDLQDFFKFKCWI
ncbi:uncharacterized protein [Nothobranchius furzeri]|uniref:uncharacterized protein isoform X2 n=1 Tax=Nothobranchius furzeri TaxID=105023 RepID=UPI003904A294